MKKLRTFAVFCLVAVLLGGVCVYANTTYGTESDPLITLSYLNSVLKPELEQKYSQQTQAAIADVETRMEENLNGSYVAVTVKANQTLTCKAGCEFMVRSGEAYRIHATSPNYPARQTKWSNGKGTPPARRNRGSHRRRGS